MAKWICFIKLYADLTFSLSFVTYELQGRCISATPLTHIFYIWQPDRYRFRTSFGGIGSKWLEKTCIFTQNWPPATYDVISRNQSNWSPLNSSQNLREGCTNSYWKRQVLMFYPLGKNSEKPYEGVASHPHPLSCTSEGCQVVEWVDIFANPVFKNPGMSIILRSVCETLRYTFLAIMSDQVSPLNTAVVSKCSKYRLRK